MKSMETLKVFSSLSGTVQYSTVQFWKNVISTGFPFKEHPSLIRVHIHCKPLFDQQWKNIISFISEEEMWKSLYKEITVEKNISRQRFKGYGCESRNATYKWRVTLSSSVYSPLNQFVWSVHILVHLTSNLNLNWY